MNRKFFKNILKNRKQYLIEVMTFAHKQTKEGCEIETKKVSQFMDNLVRACEKKHEKEILDLNNKIESQKNMNKILIEQLNDKPKEDKKNME